ncbi:Hypothetical protein LUCI_4444 [Lucifera butyrica]|uniref:Uncharacterized protein n=2 Tax=Lucifera butyrica TaxID=1351585 RepID=A0A498RJG2_9FIRM|nr:Hypothetical protein LUCI_4444 [Lucifera butyrica]
MDIVETQRLLANLLYSHWLSEELFSFSWFTIVIPMVVLSGMFVILVDKSRLRELILYGSILAVAYGLIYPIASTMTLWQFQNNLIPYALDLVPFAFIFHPILHIFAYQYASSWKSFAITNTISAGLFAFVALPVYVWLKVIQFYNWNYLYSFILAWGISFIARAVVIWLADIEQRHSTQPNQVSLSPRIQPAMKLLEDDENE